MRQIFLISLVQKEDYNLMKSEDENQLMQQKYPPPCSLNLIKVSQFRNVLCVSSILPKSELENLNFCPNLLGQKFFVSFWKN